MTATPRPAGLSANAAVDSTNPAADYRDIDIDSIDLARVVAPTGGGYPQRDRLARQVRATGSRIHRLTLRSARRMQWARLCHAQRGRRTEVQVGQLAGLTAWPPESPAVLTASRI